MLPPGACRTPTFMVNLTGEYRFLLTVYDNKNAPSCFPAVYDVTVESLAAIQVELTWSSSGVADGAPTREAADLDIHFAHPWAGGPDLDDDGKPDGWYDLPFDCFSFNPNPNWGSYDPNIDDDPVLGILPEAEILTLDIPESASYRVGVHYFRSWGEPADAVVRLCLYGYVVNETPAVTMNPLDMWEVLSIEPTGKVQEATGKDGSWKINPGYSNPYFP